MKSILIFGSEGFIGNYLIKYFIQQGYEVYGCDLFEASKQGGYYYSKVSRLSPELEDVFLRHQYDFCINAAGSGNVAYSMSHPVSDFEANSLDTIRVLDTIRRLNINCKYLHLSSAAVYGNPPALPVTEDMPVHPLSPYGWHKLMSEMICNEYHKIYGLKITILRPFSVYGNGLKKQLLWDICQKLHHNSSISLFGSGNETRDFIHISDLVKLVMKIMENSNFQFDIYNAASGIETSISDIAKLFEINFIGKKNISFSGEIKKGDPVNWKAEISKSLAIGFQPKKGIEDGIIDYINWYCAFANE